MFGGDDPFGMFGHMRRQMNMMDQMMESMMDPFGGMGMRQQPFGMLTDGRRPSRASAFQQNQLNPFDPFGMLSGGMMGGGIFGALNNLQQHAMNDPNSHVFTQSTVMSFGPDGRPRVVESSTRKTGDVRETRKVVRDGEEEKLEIGRTIGERTHIIEKKRDKDGRTRKQQKFVNLDEDEAVDFDLEFQERAKRNVYTGRNERYGRSALEDGQGVGSSMGRRHNERYGLDDGYDVSSRFAGSHQNAPIITLPEEDDEEPMSNSRTTTHNGPIIREISEEEAEQSIPKRRRDNQGRTHWGNH